MGAERGARSAACGAGGATETSGEAAIETREAARAISGFSSNATETAREERPERPGGSVTTIETLGFLFAGGRGVGGCEDRPQRSSGS